MMHVIVRDGLEDTDFVARHTLGFAALKERLADYPPARAAAITGIPAADIERLAREYATTRPALLRLCVGMERYSNCGMTVRTVSCLPALIGAFRERGGGLFQFTVNLFFDAVDYGVVLADPSLPAPPRTVHLAQLGRALTDAALDPPITWLMVYNLNPLVTLPNQNLVRRGLAREDLFTVVHEQFLTETARYADVVLPATTQFEHLDLMPAWGQTYLALNPPAIAPLGEAVPNTELFRRLSRALGYTEDTLLRSDEDRVRALLASGSPYLDGITYERLQAEGWARLAMPDGWLPRANGQFPTPSGKVEFHSEALAARGFDPLPDYQPIAEDPAEAAAWPLRLVSAKIAHYLNSEYVNLPHRGTRDHHPQVNIHPLDAAARDIADGARVRVFNRLGTVEVLARVSDDTGPGVVSLPFNWWSSSTFNGSSANALTPDELSDRGFGSNAFDARVEIARVA
jgi:anaerobic selenocysteine-containing dehydrogenase